MFTCLLKDNHIMGWEKAFLGVANDSLERGDIFFLKKGRVTRKGG